MPSITISSKPASHTDGKGLRNTRDRLNHIAGLASVPVAADEVIQALQSHTPSPEHYYEHISPGCEGIVHTVAVHFAHTPTEDVTTKFVLTLFIFKS